MAHYSSSGVLTTDGKAPPWQMAGRRDGAADSRGDRFRQYIRPRTHQPERPSKRGKARRYQSPRPQTATP